MAQPWTERTETSDRLQQAIQAFCQGHANREMNYLARTSGDPRFSAVTSQTDSLTYLDALQGLNYAIRNMGEFIDSATAPFTRSDKIGLNNLLTAFSMGNQGQKLNKEQLEALSQAREILTVFHQY